LPNTAEVFAATRRQFILPEAVVYLDGNSLGPLTAAARQRLVEELDEHWAPKLIRGWNESGWMDLPNTVGDKIAALVGAPPGSVVAADSTSVNLFKVLSAALAMRPGRKVVLSDSGNFPTDLYVAQGLVRSLGAGHELRTVAPDDIASAIDDSVAVVMLTEVDYRTGRLHSMAELTELAHEAGALIIWDLCHSAGALPVQLEDSRADFAVGCGYKYLNGGPGAPAYMYVRPDLIASCSPALCGWMGHAEPFAFGLGHVPAEGIGRLRCGTPPILAMACLDAALNVWEGVDLQDVREVSSKLSSLFIEEVERRCPEFVLASPRDPDRRGSHVSFRFPHGYAVMQALIGRGVIGDFRAPDMMRFGFTPLYIDQRDVLRAVEVLGEVVRDRLWDCAEFKARRTVT